MAPTCTLCDRPALAHGWCSAHYQRWRRTGDPHGSTRKSLEERFWEKVDRGGAEGSCWTWTASVNPLGYGKFAVAGAPSLAHRVAYELITGPIPAELELDHLCRNPSCVNPAHLEAVSHRENMLRGDTVAALHAAKTHCVNGHPFNEANTYRGRGHRECRVCRAAGMRRKRSG